MYVLGVFGVLPVSDDSGTTAMKRRCRMSKPVKIQKFSRSDKDWGDGVTLLKRDLRPYGPLRAARAPDRRTQTAASGGAIPSVLQMTSSGSEEIAFNPVAVRSPPLADSLLLLTHSYSTKPSRYGGVYQRTVFPERRRLFRATDIKEVSRVPVTSLRSSLGDPRGE